MLPSHTLHCLQSERRQHTFFPKILLHLISFFYPICLDYFTFIWIKPTGGFFFFAKIRTFQCGMIGYIFSHFTSYGYKYFPKTVFPVSPTACMLRSWYSTNHTHITQIMRVLFSQYLISRAGREASR